MLKNKLIIDKALIECTSNYLGLIEADTVSVSTQDIKQFENQFNKETVITANLINDLMVRYEDDPQKLHSEYCFLLSKQLNMPIRPKYVSTQMEAIEANAQVTADAVNRYLEELTRRDPNAINSVEYQNAVALLALAKSTRNRKRMIKYLKMAGALLAGIGLGTVAAILLSRVSFFESFKNWFKNLFTKKTSSSASTAPSTVQTTPSSTPQTPTQSSTEEVTQQAAKQAEKEVKEQTVSPSDYKEVTQNTVPSTTPAEAPKQSGGLFGSVGGLFSDVKSKSSQALANFKTELKAGLGDYENLPEQALADKMKEAMHSQETITILSYDPKNLNYEIAQKVGNLQNLCIRLLQARISQLEKITSKPFVDESKIRDVDDMIKANKMAFDLSRMEKYISSNDKSSISHVTLEFAKFTRNLFKKFGNKSSYELVNNW